MDPHHTRFLQSNEEPDDKQLADITTIASKLRSDIICSVESPTSSFTFLLGSFQRYTEYQLVLSPIRRVPSELLARIFHYCLSSERHDGGTEYTSIVHVCRYWRVLIRPLLLSGGTFVVPHGSTKSGSRSKEVLHEFHSFLESLPSSTESLFSVSITDSLDIHSDVKNPIMDALLMQCHRFISLKISIRSRVFKAFAGRIIHRVNNLRSLNLTVPGKAGEYGGYLYVFESAQSLQHIVVTTPMSMLFKIPVSQLLSYKERSLGAVNVPAVLLYGSMLEELEYTIHTPTFMPFRLDGGSDGSRVLESLDLKTYDINGVTNSRVIGNSTSRSVDADVDCSDQDDASIRTALPHLRSIRIRDPYRDVTLGLYQTILDSCHGPSLILTRMALCGSRTKPSELSNLLRLTPNLRYLECRDISTVDLVHMTAGEAPKLENLVIHDAGIGIVSALEDFVAARRSAGFEGGFLSSVRLLNRNPKDNEEFEKALGVTSFDEDARLEMAIQRLRDIIKTLDERGRKGNIWKEIPSMLRRVIQLSSPRDEAHVITNVFTELEAVSNLQVIQVSNIHTLHTFSLLYWRSSSAAVESLFCRVQKLLKRWVLAFQLQQLGCIATHLHEGTRKSRWLVINPQCITLAFASFHRIEEHKLAEDLWSGMPSEYDVLFGHYKPPTREEVFWVVEDCSNDIL